MVFSGILILSTLNLFSQSSYKLLQLSHDVSGSGLGENISIGVGIAKDCQLISINAVFQKKKVNLSGINVNYKYIVCKSENEKTELFFSINTALQARAYLSDKSLRIEQQCNPEQNKNYESLSMSVFESYAGFGLKFIHTEKISTSYSIGYGGYTTLNKTYDYKMYRQKSAQSLQFQFTMNYRIQKSQKK